MEDKKAVVRLDRTKNALRNMVAGGVNKVVTLVFPFILRTILIRVLGKEYAGLNSLFVSILDVLNMAELGFGTAIVYCMYKPIAQDNQEEICALLNLFRKIYFTIGLIVLGIGIALMPFLEYLIKESYPSDINLYVLYAIYLFNSCSSYFFLGYKSSIISAHQRLDVTQSIATIVKGIMYIVQMVVLVCFESYYLYAVMLPIFTILINLVTAYQVKKLFPQYMCKGNVTKEVKSDLKEKVSGLMISRLCAITRNSFDSIFASAYLGLALTAIYGNYYFIMYSVTSILAIIVQAVLAGVGNSIQTETVEQNYNDMKRFNFMYLWISSICTVCLLCLYQPFMYLWMGEENMLPLSSVVLFCAYFFLLKMGDMQSVYYNAAGLWWHYRKCAIVEAGLNLLLNYIFVQIWGLNGIIAGTLVSLFLINFLYAERLVFKYYFKNGKTLQFYGMQVKYAVVTAVVCGITYVICNMVGYTDWSSCVWALILRGCVCIVLPNLLFYGIYHQSAEFGSAKKWIAEKRAR